MLGIDPVPLVAVTIREQGPGSDRNACRQDTLNTCHYAGLPPTSLIICSRNRPQLLLDCVQSVLNCNEIPTEIIIIDDSDMPHSSLSSVSSNPACELRYLWTRSIGLSRANNDGIAAARYDILVFTQDDVLVTPTWFGIIVRALVKAGQMSVITGKILPGAEETCRGFAPSTKDSDEPEVFEGRVGVDVLYAQNMAIYRSAFERVGLFDQRLGPGTAYPAAEDNDFGFRLLESGYRINYEPRAVTYHRAWRSERDYLSLYWGYACGQGAYYAKHMNAKDLYILRIMIRDIWSHILEFSHLLRRRTIGYINVVYVCGLVFGGARWGFSQRRRPPW